MAPVARHLLEGGCSLRLSHCSCRSSRGRSRLMFSPASCEVGRAIHIVGCTRRCVVAAEEMENEVVNTNGQAET